MEPNLNLEETKIHYPLISAGANKLNPSQVTFGKNFFFKFVNISFRLFWAIDAFSLFQMVMSMQRGRDRPVDSV